MGFKHITKFVVGVIWVVCCSSTPDDINGSYGEEYYIDHPKHSATFFKDHNNEFKDYHPEKISLSDCLQKVHNALEKYHGRTLSNSPRYGILKLQMCLEKDGNRHRNVLKSQLAKSDRNSKEYAPMQNLIDIIELDDENDQYEYSDESNNSDEYLVRNKRSPVAKKKSSEEREGKKKDKKKKDKKKKDKKDKCKKKKDKKKCKKTSSEEDDDDEITTTTQEPDEESTTSTTSTTTTTEETTTSKETEETTEETTTTTTEETTTIAKSSTKKNPDNEEDTTTVTTTTTADEVPEDPDYNYY